MNGPNPSDETSGVVVNAIEGPPVLSPPPQPSASIIKKPFPGILQSLALSGIFYGISIAVAVPFQIVRHIAEVRMEPLAELMVQQLVAWPVVLWIGLRWAGVSFREAFPMKLDVRLLPALLVGSFGAAIVLSAASSLIPMPEAVKKIFLEVFRTENKWLLFVPVALLAPIGEEMFFRGQVLRGYLGRYSATKAVWASALLFAVFHLNPWQFVVALPLGVVYAWMVMRTGSIAPGMVSHFAINFSCNFLLTPLGEALGYSAEELEALDYFPLSMLGIGAVAAAAGGFVLWRQLRRKLSA